MNVPALKAPKNGYVFVYCSNESQHNVYFDNFQVFHDRGPILEETHYYPFGLTMAGISSKALAPGYVENKKQFNGIEHTTDFDLNQYDAFYRNYNPQIGRWFQIDPKPTDYESPYAAMGNNPILYSDFLGDTSIFYNAGGIQIQKMDDGSKNNTITVIPEDKQKGFDFYVNSGAAKGFFKDADGNFDNGAYVGMLRTIGITYDYDSYFTYFDQNSNAIYTGDYYEPKDNKGPLINEHMSATEIVNGHMKIKLGTDNEGGPFASSPSGSGDGLIHTHASENRTFSFPDKIGGNVYSTITSLGGKAALGDVFSGDLGKTGQSAGTAKFNIAVSKTTVYLYNQGHVVIAISRNGTGSKNPDSIK